MGEQAQKAEGEVQTMSSEDCCRAAGHLTLATITLKEEEEDADEAHAVQMHEEELVDYLRVLKPPPKPPRLKASIAASGSTNSSDLPSLFCTPSSAATPATHAAAAAATITPHANAFAGAGVEGAAAVEEDSMTYGPSTISSDGDGDSIAAAAAPPWALRMNIGLHLAASPALLPFQGALLGGNHR